MTQMRTGKKLMLVYNAVRDRELSLPIEGIPEDWIITTDRQYFQQADVVVFYLPSLLRELEHDLNKPNGQLWVAWNMEPEKKYPGFNSPEIRELFDLRMSYRQDADVVYPFYRYEYLECFTQKKSASHKKNKKCVLVSDIMQEGSRWLFLRELMKHTEIDIHRVSNSSEQLPVNDATKTSPDMFRDYKFVIAFEDTADTDYVTEKFFEPLVAGAVPVYFGAPNIRDFAPGDNCFVDVRQFASPRSLAHLINTCYEDESVYAKFFAWKNRPLLPSFIRKAAMLKEHPFVQLCRKAGEQLNVKK